MRHIKNFLHNINDIALAIIIVLLAAGIIYWRLQIILDYPEKLAEEQAVYNEEQAEQETAEPAAAEQAETEDAAAGQAAVEEGAAEQAAPEDGSAEQAAPEEGAAEQAPQEGSEQTQDGAQ